jgi:hypothetical protein
MKEKKNIESMKDIKDDKKEKKKEIFEPDRHNKVFINSINFF